MNNQVKWAIQDFIKEHFLEMIKNGVKREKIIITECNDSLMEIPEVKGAIKFLIDGEYIEKLSETEYIITKGYYEWLLMKVAGESIEESLNFNISSEPPMIEITGGSLKAFLMK